MHQTNGRAWRRRAGFAAAAMLALSCGPEDSRDQPLPPPPPGDGGTELDGGTADGGADGGGGACVTGEGPREREWECTPAQDARIQVNSELEDGQLRIRVHAEGFEAGETIRVSVDAEGDGFAESIIERTTNESGGFDVEESVPTCTTQLSQAVALSNVCELLIDDLDDDPDGGDEDGGDGGDEDGDDGGDEDGGDGGDDDDGGNSGSGG